jgi:predicted metal-binding transcription factor (methanogenesis marker protein 9)
MIDCETMNQLIYLETRYLKIEKFMFRPSKPSPIVTKLQKLLLDLNAFDWVDITQAFGERVFPEEE